MSCCYRGKYANSFTSLSQVQYRGSVWWAKLNNNLHKWQTNACIFLTPLKTWYLRWYVLAHQGKQSQQKVKSELKFKCHDCAAIPLTLNFLAINSTRHKTKKGNICSFFTPSVFGRQKIILVNFRKGVGALWPSTTRFPDLVRFCLQWSGCRACSVRSERMVRTSVAGTRWTTGISNRPRGASSG